MNMASSVFARMVLLVILLLLLFRNYVLGDYHEDDSDECDSSEEVDQPLSYSDCVNGLQKCCFDRHSNRESTAVCAVACNGWRAVFYDQCELIYFKCKHYNYRFKEYQKGSYQYLKYGCHRRNVVVFKDLLKCPGIDKIPPAIYFVPMDIRKRTDVGKPTATVWWTPPSAHDESGHVTLTSFWQPGDDFPIGITQVEYTATDAAGNMVKASFTVTVQDKENPVIMNYDIPSVIHIEIQPGETSTNVRWRNPLITDNSGHIARSYSTYQPGNMFYLGMTEVTYYAEDPYKNSADFSFDVLITCPDPPHPGQPCNCNRAPSLSYCQFPVKTPVEMTVRCTNASGLFSSSKTSSCRCGIEPPTFPVCRFPSDKTLDTRLRSGLIVL